MFIFSRFCRVIPPLSSIIARSQKMNTIVKKNAIDKEYVVKTITSILRSDTPDRHKGMAGRIGIIGGSLEYTGAPFYAGMSALRVGADLIHIFCESAAAIPIKCYSPELIVHPVLDSKNGAELIKPWLERLHVIVIGPGLGRKEDTFKVVTEVIHMIKNQNIPVVVDADGLFLVTNNLKVLEGFQTPVVLTPNKVEYSRLVNSIGDENFKGKLGESVTILKKGNYDELLSCYDVQWKSNEGGSSRRSGGQGDLLSGAIATLLHWTMSNKETLETKENKSAMATSVACYAACRLIRLCNEKAFMEMGRGAVASDMIKYIPESLQDLLSS